MSRGSLKGKSNKVLKVLDRIKIILKWCFVFGGFFLAQSIVFMPVIAALSSFIIVVGAFFHPKNHADIETLKRPVYFIEKNNG